MCRYNKIKCYFIVHFRFDSDHPGMVFARVSPEYPEVSFQLFKSKDLTLPMEVPQPIKSPGMDAARKWYLYHKIRPFVADPWKDVMCPLPMFRKLLQLQIRMKKRPPWMNRPQLQRRSLAKDRAHRPWTENRL